MDLGDNTRHYCLVNERGEVVQAANAESGPRLDTTAASRSRRLPMDFLSSCERSERSPRLYANAAKYKGEPH